MLKGMDDISENNVPSMLPDAQTFRSWFWLLCPILTAPTLLIFSIFLITALGEDDIIANFEVWLIALLVATWPVWVLPHGKISIDKNTVFYQSFFGKEKWIDFKTAIITYEKRYVIFKSSADESFHAKTYKTERLCDWISSCEVENGKR